LLTALSLRAAVAAARDGEARATAMVRQRSRRVLSLHSPSACGWLRGTALAERHDRAEHLVGVSSPPALMISHRLQDVAADGCRRRFASAGLGCADQESARSSSGAARRRWSPCVGPTLGAALGLATRSDTLAHAAAIMAAFGLGSATLLLAAGYASRAVIGQRLRLLQAGERGRFVFGIVLLLVGASVASGVDKVIEAVVLARLPQWWIDLLASA
jgi:hypothetical protein